VDGPLLWQVGSMRAWKCAARWLARLHSRHTVAAGNSDGLSSPPLLRFDAPYLTSWIQRAERFVSHRRYARSDGLPRKFRRLASRYDRVIERLLALPQSFIHGEFYPSNVIMRGGTPARRVCPIDWESAAIGPSLIDLAALTSGEWTSDQKRLLVASYRETLAPTQGWPPSLGELMELVDLGQLHLSVQWLGWAADWVAPRMHANDWLREAVRLSSRLHL
jgi:aminoglycoside phosphotransferase (APT) family kinase protein